MSFSFRRFHRALCYDMSTSLQHFYQILLLCTQTSSHMGCTCLQAYIRWYIVSLSSSQNVHKFVGLIRHLWRCKLVTMAAISCLYWKLLSFSITVNFLIARIFSYTDISSHKFFFQFFNSLAGNR